MRFGKCATVLGLTITLLPELSFSAAPQNLITSCGLGVPFGEGTCQCIARAMPDLHLDGNTVQWTTWKMTSHSRVKTSTPYGRCEFQNPPPEFDPSTASDKALQSWGIWKSAAPELKDPAIRAAYFHGVKRALDFASDSEGFYFGLVGMMWRPADGAPCTFTGELAILCASQGIKPPPIAR